MNETNWKPTEEELVSLGFVKIEFEDSLNDYFKLEFEFKPTTIFHKKTQAWFTAHRYSNAFDLYPKSLEELRSLISMMKP